MALRYRSVPALKKAYAAKKEAIRSRLSDFSRAGEGAQDEIFLELVFCLFTPQSRARAADAAVRRLRTTGYAFSGNLGQIRSCLTAVRFPNNKARFVLLARRTFSSPFPSPGTPSLSPVLQVTGRLPLPDQAAAREWLVRNVKGLGMKEASHFLRNIGHGSELAILDVHVLRNLVKHGVIRQFPVTLSEKKYRNIEEKLRSFARAAGITPAELDLLFWSEGTGEIFK